MEPPVSVQDRLVSALPVLSEEMWTLHRMKSPWVLWNAIVESRLLWPVQFLDALVQGKEATAQAHWRKEATAVPGCPQETRAHWLENCGPPVPCSRKWGATVQQGTPNPGLGSKEPQGSRWKEKRFGQLSPWASLTWLCTWRKAG